MNENQLENNSRILINSNRTINKNAFLQALSCSKKLIYRKQNYPTSQDKSSHLNLINEDKKLLVHLAKSHFVHGISLDKKSPYHLRYSAAALEAEAGSLFEGTFRFNNLLTDVDIIELDSNRLSIISVESKCWDISKDNLENLKQTEKALLGIAFQYYVMKNNTPEREILCSIMMPVKQKAFPVNEIRTYVKYENGKPDYRLLNEAGFANMVVSSEWMHREDVTNEVLALQEFIIDKTNTFSRILKEGITTEEYKKTFECRNCEYRIYGEDRNGFSECWGETDSNKKLILDLYMGSKTLSDTHSNYMEELIDRDCIYLSDIDPERLMTKKGEPGKTNLVQIRQLDCTLNEKEWISDALIQLKERVNYPLQFLDFETFSSAIPVFEGMLAYEKLPFQWSCHTLERPDTEIEHNEWLQIDGESHALNFLKSLRAVLGEQGSILVWSGFEKQVLNSLHRNAEKFPDEDRKLFEWLGGLLHANRIIDMNAYCMSDYYHPLMGGKSSIKTVLPAVIRLFDDPATMQHISKEAYEILVSRQNPYSHNDSDSAVVNGTDAMSTFINLRYHRSENESFALELKKNLLDYCRIDTLAMVIIAGYWKMI